VESLQGFPTERRRRGVERFRGFASGLLATGLLATGLLAGPLAMPAASAAGSVPVRARSGMVASQNFIASRIGADTMMAGGNAVDAAVATAFALAVTHPSAGNIGGGGFLVYRPATGDPVVWDFREVAPARARADMFLTDGKYDTERHHEGHLSVGVPGSVHGLYSAWKAHGRLEWKRLLQPAISLARQGFVVTDGLARSLAAQLPEMKRRGYEASVAQFSKNGVPYEMGEVLRQPDLGRTLERIAAEGPAGFYEGETARLLEEEMKRHDGWITRADLKLYRSLRREPVQGTYRGLTVLGAPPPSSGGTTLIEMLRILEGYDLARSGPGSARTLHLMAEAMRRGFADRARYLGDPGADPGMQELVRKLTSDEHAATLRASIDPERASQSSPDRFEWPAESEETTHLSVVDAERNAVSLTTTLEGGYGSRIVVPGAGFLLNNEMGDFNPVPGVTDATGRIGTEPNLAAPGKRMLSSMSPTIVVRDGKPLLVIGSPGGRTIINTVLQVVVGVVDFGMNVQEAIDAGRIHHQWLPDVLQYERRRFSPDTLALLSARGHALEEVENQGSAHGIVYDAERNLLEGGADRRSPDSAAIGY